MKTQDLFWENVLTFKTIISNHNRSRAKFKKKKKTTKKCQKDGYYHIFPQ